MSDNAFKNIFSPALTIDFGERLAEADPGFSKEKFTAYVLENLEHLELKQRTALMAEGFREYLSGDYPQQIKSLLSLLGDSPETDEGITETGFPLMPISSFIEAYGVGHFDISMEAIYELTQRFTGEFCIRPFLRKDLPAALAYLKKWATDSNFHVRRLVSEGTRPRLPWGTKVQALSDEPTIGLELLEMLKDDPELYVRRSVANHLNDISKAHPETVIQRLQVWAKKKDVNRQWIVKHALRGLVKEGNPDALELLGFGGGKLEVKKLRCQPDIVSIGDQLVFSFTLENSGDEPAKAMVDYRLHLVKANGSRNPKVFKLKQVDLAPGASIEVSKKQSFRPVTTRKLYPGLHAIDIQVNGRIFESVEFELEA